ncbi:hypothetical protein LIER_20225 [Lithospermum erythrorhizon]|uniref:Retrotransposon gag domain-containing protein n=1 Tax=Lithospermum erythrorhizon TaxID=34254 RepID=A0AAV3QLT0_LITER
MTSFEELKKRFTRTYEGRFEQDKDELSLMTIRQRENEAISLFPDRFQMEFNLVNQRTYKYIRIEGSAKRDEMGHDKHPMEEKCRRSPKTKRRNTVDMIRAPDRGYCRADLPRSNAFFRLHDELKKKEAK